LWTEFVADEETAEYMLLPRLAAMAEALWSPAGKDWPAFVGRLKGLLPHYDAAGLRYRPLDF
jgi:hexosaminidase